MYRTLTRFALLAGLLASSLIACASPESRDLDRQALETAIQRWEAAVDARDTGALSATMTEDVELADNIVTARGRKAAIEALRVMAADGPLGTVTRELTLVHDVAWRSVGLAQTSKNGDVQGRGLALEIWKRVNGEWKLHRRLATGSPGVSLTRPSLKEPVLDRPKD